MINSCSFLVEEGLGSCLVHGAAGLVCDHKVAATPLLAAGRFSVLLIPSVLFTSKEHLHSCSVLLYLLQTVQKYGPMHNFLLINNPRNNYL